MGDGELVTKTQKVDENLNGNSESLPAGAIAEGAYLDGAGQGFDSFRGGSGGKASAALLPIRERPVHRRIPRHSG